MDRENGPLILVATVVVAGIVAAGAGAGLGSRPSTGGSLATTPPGTVVPAATPAGGPAAATVAATTRPGDPVVDGRLAILRPPAAPVTRPLPAAQPCAGLADPGFTARCGSVRTGTAELVWIVQTRPAPRSTRMAVYRRAGPDSIALALQADDEAGLAFSEARVTSTDTSNDGHNEAVFRIQRYGADQVLSVEVVDGEGEVVVHRDYAQGSTRVTRGEIQGWARSADATVLAGESLRFADGAWRVAWARTAPSSAAYPRDVPDPFVLAVGGSYYGYGTAAGGVNVTTVRSPDLRRWAPLPDALPVLPAWSRPGFVWAPSVLPRGDGYVLYYTTRDRASERQCLSRAWSGSPGGPFVDSSAGPFVCQLEHGGSIDPSPFVDADGAAHLLWKSDGTDDGAGAKLWSQPLSADGLALTGSPRALLDHDQPWEAPLVEGPSMVRDGDRLYLFYVAGVWQSAGYAIGYATCETPAGPCVKGANLPLLASAGPVAGPGGPEFVTDGEGRRWMAYHGWTPTEVGYAAGGRRMLHLSPLRFENGVPVVDRGEATPPPPFLSR